MAFDVVMAGGGFGGLYAARRLERRLPRHSARVLLVSDVMLYAPLLPGAASGSLEPRHVVVPLREELDPTRMLCWTAAVKPAPVVRGCDNVWAIGDAAAVPDPAKRRRARPFRYRTLGVFVDMGRRWAVATILRIRLRGFPAWFAARTYHLAMMPGVTRKVRLGLDWAVGLASGRASAELGRLGRPVALRESDEAIGGS